MNEISMKVYPKTIYGDIVDMPSPLLLGITIHYYNHTDDNLYMKIFGSGPSPWSSNSVELGLLNSGSNAYINLDNFLSRTKPTSEATEEITLILRAYSDSDYSNLLHEFSRNTTIVFIKSDDGSWTTDELDDFDDGTVQGWEAVKDDGHYQFGGFPRAVVVTDYVLSTPYSCRMEQAKRWSTFSNFELRGRLYKSFTTPNKDKVFAIINVRTNVPENYSYGTNKYLEIQAQAAVLVHLGKSYDEENINYFPQNKWLRIVVPLPKNTLIELRIVHDVCQDSISSGALITRYAYLWLDDFKIISK